MEGTRVKNPLAVGGTAVAILVAVLIVALDPGWAERPVGQAEVIRMLGAMFPGSAFTAAPDGAYVDQDGWELAVDRIRKGPYTRPGTREILIVAVSQPEQLRHAQGLYNGYAAVFDVEGIAPVSAVMTFVADEGHTAVFEGRDLDYVLFVGSTTFQGWTEWTGGLWRAGREWSRLWPEDPTFWKDAAVEISRDGMRVLSRKILESPDRLIPEYIFEPAYVLKWDPGSETFETLP